MLVDGANCGAALTRTCATPTNPLNKQMSRNKKKEVRKTCVLKFIEKGQRTDQQ
jgi:hypothetical protein